MVNEIIELKEAVESLMKDAEKFDSGNNVAGTRLRGGLMAIKKGCDSLRKTITDIKNTRKSK